jgi:hypothetical protein
MSLLHQRQRRQRLVFVLWVCALSGCKPNVTLSPNQQPIQAVLPELPRVEPSGADRAREQVRTRGPIRAYTDWDLSETAADALGRIGAPAVPALIQALREPSAQQRLRAARVLARIGPAALEAVPVLIERLEDADPLVRKAAARALGQIGPEAIEAVPSLMRVLQDQERPENGSGWERNAESPDPADSQPHGSATGPGPAA